MAKLEAFTHLDTMRGKYSRTDKVYTRVRKFDEQVIGVRLKHPTTNDPPSAAQLTVQAKMTAVAALVKAAFADAEQKATLRAEWLGQHKYKTLTSYAFHKFYIESSNPQNP